MDSQGNVIPAKAGIQKAQPQASTAFVWMPACAGMTGIHYSQFN